MSGKTSFEKFCQSIHSFKEDIEGLFAAMIFRKSKWLLGGIYHPPSQPEQYFS